MKRHTVDKIRAALAARTPGTWTAPARGGSVIVPFGDTGISPRFLEWAAAERARDLESHRRQWDRMTPADQASHEAAGWSRDVTLMSSVDSYGGDLVCESIGVSDAELVAAAPAWLEQVVAELDQVEAVAAAAGLDGGGLAWLADGGPPPAGLEVSEVITALARELVAARAELDAARRGPGHVGVVYPAAERCRLCGAADRSRCGHFVGGGAG